jgi:hypothetical protein
VAKTITSREVKDMGNLTNTHNPFPIKDTNVTSQSPALL